MKRDARVDFGLVIIFAGAVGAGLGRTVGEVVLGAAICLVGTMMLLSVGWQERRR